MRSFITNIKTSIIDKKQNVYFFLNNHEKPLRLNSTFLTNTTSIECHEFELLIGLSVDWNYYEIGEEVHFLNDKCKYAETLVKKFSINFEGSSPNGFRSSSIEDKRVLFERITSVNNSEDNIKGDII